MSEIVMNRIDDRLIHGQVMVTWVGMKRCNTIWIVDDQVAKNPMMLDIFSFAAPQGIKIDAFTIDQASEQIKSLSPDRGNKRIILLVKHPESFVRLTDAGYIPDDINYGAMANKSVDPKAAVEVAPNCMLSLQDIEFTEKLHNRGIHIWIQLVPHGGHKVVDWKDARKKAGLS
jgi:mannose/fructose/N-acetylgalactosamine-specific phosphotransferase system component IIB